MTVPDGAAPRSSGSADAPVADQACVEALLAAQAPQLAGRRMVPGPTGWDNAHWLLEGGLAVRLPRRAMAVPLVDHEVRVLGAVADRLPLPTPRPVVVGEPTDGWPWPWTVIEWFEGERADLAYPPPAPEEHAAALGSFLAALHAPADADAPCNPLRGVPLERRAPRTEEMLHRIDVRGRIPGEVRATLRRRWEDGLAAPAHDGPPTWLHGDLHPGNQLADAGVLVAVVDWGDSCAGDPATDLATAWWTLPTSVHATLREAYGGVDEATWRRAGAWAAAIVAFLLDAGPTVGDPAIVAMAARAAARLAEG